MNNAYVKIRRYIIGSFISFLGMALVCSLLYPQVFDNYQYGISTFGSVGKTAGLYSICFIATILFMIVITRELQRYAHTLPLRAGLWLNATCMTGILITSVGAYSQWHSTYLIHITFAIALALSQTAVSVWAIRQKGVSFLDYALGCGFILIVMVSILPLVGDIPGLRSYPLREVLAFVCAMSLIGRTVLRIVRSSSKSSE